MTRLLQTVQPLQRGVTETWRMVDHGMYQVLQRQRRQVCRA